jgi:hypothetical protein
MLVAKQLDKSKITASYVSCLAMGHWADAGHYSAHLSPKEKREAEIGLYKSLLAKKTEPDDAKAARLRRALNFTTSELDTIRSEIGRTV